MLIKIQLGCTAVTSISLIVMGCHLFADDGISHPTHVLTVTAILALAGLIGNAVAAFIRANQKQDDQDRP